MASRVFGSRRPVLAHLVRGGGGLAGEVADLRTDTEAAFQQLQEEMGTTFDDAFILNLQALVEQGVTADGGPAGAAAYAAAFDPTGATQGNLGPLTVGPAAILASNLAAQAFLQTLTFSNYGITRKPNLDGSLTVNILRNADVRFVGAPLVPNLSWGVSQFVIAPSGLLLFESFIDLRPGAVSGFPFSVYSNATRPAATTYSAGGQIFNTDDNAPNWSDGTNWRDAVGAIT
jgi:hypothetical protein